MPGHRTIAESRPMRISRIIEGLLGRLLVKFSRNIPSVLHANANALKDRLGREIWSQNGGRVAYGHYQGMIIPLSSPWSGSMDTGAMILGTYEKQVVEFLHRTVPKTRTFIDVGASWGFHAIGCRVGGLASRVIAYESETESAELCRRYSLMNNAPVDVRGVLTAGDLIVFFDSEKVDPEGSVFLFDIEGGERQLLTAEAISVLSKSWLCIEIHDFLEGYDTAEFIQRFSASHKTRLVESDSSPPPQALPDWDELSIALVLSENRPRRMKWLLCEPKSLSDS